jgi:hypothetical protein
VDPVKERAVAAPALKAPAVPKARWVEGEWIIARILRFGAVASGGLFFASLCLELLPQTEGVSVAMTLLRKGAASVLLVTPVVRLVTSGVLLGLRGEYRYTLYAAGVLVLLGLAVGSRFAV